MKNILLFCSFILNTTAIFAQQNLNLPVKRCASYEVFQQMLQSDPLFIKNQRDIEEFTKKFIAQGGADAMGLAQALEPVYTIPVVVHVVYKTAAENISKAQVQSQIEALNKDFQKLNDDVSGVPSVWTTLVANCRIQFCLAGVDPAGKPTTGIRRVQTNKPSFNSNDNVKFTVKGGDDAWPASDYLNLWVCNLGSRLLGYAQFPGGNAATDGVVIDYTAFGTTGTADAPYNLGRTTTHEIGHWLNLRHIWGDDGGACTGSDLVGDTPNQGDENYGCPSSARISCGNGPDGDMYINYMDYTDDACMFMFTKGQKNRIFATLKTGGSRNSVTISGKCGPQVATASKYAEIPDLLSVIPNPVSYGSATVSYKLGRAAKIKLVITDAYANTRFVINAGNQPAGEYRVHPSEFMRLTNGTYIITLLANGQIYSTTRFVVNK
jgi:hypothetical protein